MFDLGTQELIVIFIVALLVFGPKRLPELARTLGRGVRELKTAMRGVKETLEEAEEEVSKEVKDVKTGIEEHLIKGSPVSFYGDDKKEDEEEVKDKKEEKGGEAIRSEPAQQDNSRADKEEKKEGSGTEKDG